MDPETELFEELEQSLAQDAAPVAAAAAALDYPELDLADLFLEELNRLWADPEPLSLA
jgi:hypothetical protein